MILNDYTINLNLYKQEMNRLATEAPRVLFSPLRSWPFVPHPEQKRLDEYRALQSRSTK